MDFENSERRKSVFHTMKDNEPATRMNSYVADVLGLSEVTASIESEVYRWMI